MPEHQANTIFRGLLDSGVPPEHVALQLKKNIEALRALPETTEDRDEAIEANLSIMQEIESDLETRPKF